MPNLIANKMMTSANIRLERIYTLGTILAAGMSDLETARVLHLGCQGGADLFYHASRFADAQFVGLDTDADDIAQAQKIADALGLDNIEFHAVEANNISHDLGLFDYIICDGVVDSLASDDQSAFIQNCAEHLSVRGVLCMGYATLPGWNHSQNLLQSAAMLSSQIETPQEKIKAIHGLYQISAQTSAQGNAVIKEAIEEEMRHLHNGMSSKAYLDRLGLRKNALFYEQALRLVAKADLLYMGDTNLASMFPFTYPDPLRQLLIDSPNQSMAQQYMDHLLQRRSRCGVFCAKTMSVDGNISADRLNGVQFLALVQQANPQHKINLNSNAQYEFLAGLTKIIARTKAELAACIVLLRHYMKPITMDILVQQAMGYLSQEEQENAQAQIQQLFMHVVICNGAVCHFADDTQDEPPHARPIASKLARTLAEQGYPVINLLGDSIILNPLEQQILIKLTGETPIDEHIDDIIRLAQEDVIQISEYGMVIEDPDQRKIHAQKVYMQTLERLSAIHLISPTSGG